MTIGDRIRNLRLSKGLSQEYVANVLSTTKQAIYKYENNIVTNIPMDKITTLANFFNVSPAYLMGWDNESDADEDITNIPGIRSITTKKFPMLGEIACGEPKYACEEYECYVDTDEDIDADFCLTAKGDSMIGARIMDGDIVFIKRMPIVNNGEIAAVLIDDETTLKRVYYYPEEHRLSLWAENPKYSPLNYMNEELDNIRILGKAVAFQSRIK
jgi:repressor LexA